MLAPICREVDPHSTSTFLRKVKLLEVKILKVKIPILSPPNKRRQGSGGATAGVQKHSCSSGVGSGRIDENNQRRRSWVGWSGHPGPLACSTRKPAGKSARSTRTRWTSRGETYGHAFESSRSLFSSDDLLMAASSGGGGGQ